MWRVILELRGTWWQDEEGQLVLLAVRFKLSLKFTATVNLDRFDRKGEPGTHLIKMACDGGCGRSSTEFNCGKSTHHIDQGEVLEAGAIARPDIQGIHLYEIAWPSNAVVLRFTHGIGAPLPTPFDPVTSSLLQRERNCRPVSKHAVHSYVRPVRQMLTWATRLSEDVELSRDSTESTRRPTPHRMPQR